jgi:predicted nuclease of predicted toxin-antitoxin system
VSDTLKFLLDENIPLLLKKFLELKGYSAEYAPKGINNGRFASLVLEKKWVLVSRDRDFLNSVMFPPEQFSGMIVLTPHPPKAEKLVKAMKLVLSRVKEFKGRLFVADEDDFEEY